MTKAGANNRVFGRGSWLEASRVAEVLRAETVGGLLLIGAALIALVWINTPWGNAYESLRAFTIGPGVLDLHLSLGTWAADGLLAIFFFVAGLELKREFVAGDLRDPKKAALPIVAAVCGMIGPALVYLAFAARAGAAHGWAIPTATDIAFALAVLAVISTHLPAALRTFLLTLAVVDDLLAILVIAVFYTSELHLLILFLALIPLGLFTLLAQRRVRSPWLLIPLALTVWALVHSSGIHATVAGVLLGFAVPVLRRDSGDGPGMAEYFERLMRPISAAFAVPLFAFFAAGVRVNGWDDFGAALADPVTMGVGIGLVAGKIIGVFGGTWLMTHLTRAQLADDLAWADVFGLSALAGVGFTVSLLIAELAFGSGSQGEEFAKVGILAGSATAAVLATVVLRMRNKKYRLIAARESADANRDGTPDVYQSDEQSD